MKTIGFRDIAGGSIHLYKDKTNDQQPRHERIQAALQDLKHTGNIIVYLINGRKHRRLFIKRY
jgi:trehalose-6-phosphatase